MTARRKEGPPWLPLLVSEISIVGYKVNYRNMINDRLKDFEESESNANSESLSLPLLGEPKVFNRFLKSKESEITEDDDVYEDDDENATNQTTSLLKSKEQSLLSLGSYDQSLNPFCN